jgi:virulence-associated protein VapD
MENNKNCRKAINFDLDTKALKQFYPDTKHWRKAYRDIKKFMQNEGFTHRQGSGYTSQETMSDYKMNKTMKKMSRTFPWLKKCTKKIDVTNIGQSYDYLGVIKGTKAKGVPIAETKENKDKKLQQKSEIKAKPIYSRANLIKRADEIRKQPHKEHTKNRSQDRDL